MKKRLPIIPVIVLLASSCGAGTEQKFAATTDSPALEEVNSPLPAASAPEHGLNAFLLEGHKILDFQKGDINDDQMEDVVLVQKAVQEEQLSDVVSHPSPRPLMLLLRQADGSLKLAARNDQAVYCVDCGGMMGDPYQGITIKGRYFSIEHYGGSAWRWSRIITFKFDPHQQEWFLHKDGGEYFHAANPDSTMEEKVETTKDFGVVKFADYLIYKD